MKKIIALTFFCAIKAYAVTWRVEVKNLTDNEVKTYEYPSDKTAFLPTPDLHESACLIETSSVSGKILDSDKRFSLFKIRCMNHSVGSSTLKMCSEDPTNEEKKNSLFFNFYDSKTNKKTKKTKIVEYSINVNCI